MSMINFIIDDEKNIELFHKIRSLAPDNYLINFNNYKVEFNSVDTSSFSHYDSISIDKKDDYRILLYREYNQNEDEDIIDKYSVRYDSSYEKVEAFSYFSVEELSRYLEKVISLGSMIAGLLTGAGVGLAVLFKTNKRLKENIFITVLMYCIGVISGITIELIGVVL